MERETLNLGVDYNTTVQRIVDFAKEYYEKNGKRPKPKSVAHNLKISPHFVGMQRGINQGVALAKNIPFKVDEKPPLKEVIASHLQDSPEWVLDLDDMASTVAMMREDKNDTKFRKRITTIALMVQGDWKRAAAKPKNSPEKIFIESLKAKWLDAYARKVHFNTGYLPTHQDCKIECYRIFQSDPTRQLWRDVLDAIEGQTKEQAEKAAESTVGETGIIPADPDGLIPSTMDKTVEDTTSTPDDKGAQVTEKTNLSAGKVSHLEVKEALPKPKKKKTKSKTKRGGLRQATLDKINPFRHLVGVEHDEVVAKEAGVSRTSIRRYREQNGIPRVPTVTFRQGGMVTRTDTKSTSTVQPSTTHVTMEAQGEATYLEPVLDGGEDNVPDAVWKRELMDLRRENAELRRYRQRFGDQIESWKQETMEQTARDAAEIERLNDEIERLNAQAAKLREQLADKARAQSDKRNGVPTTGSMIDQHIAMGHKVTFQIHSGD